MCRGEEGEEGEERGREEAEAGEQQLPPHGGRIVVARPVTTSAVSSETRPGR